MNKSFAKILSPNDVGENGAHQAGICVPRKNQQLLSFFPLLDTKIKNPDCWLICEDENDKSWKLRYVYYNTKTLGIGTRNEYRITHLTTYFKMFNAISGDALVFKQLENPNHYSIRLSKDSEGDLKVSAGEQSPFNISLQDVKPRRRVIKLRGWKRFH